MPVETYTPPAPEIIDDEMYDPLAHTKEKKVDTPDNTVEEVNTAEITTAQFRRQMAELGFISLIEESLDAPDSPVDIDEVLQLRTVEDSSGRRHQLRGSFAFALLLMAMEVERQRQKGRYNYFNAMTGMPAREPYQKPSGFEHRMKVMRDLMGDGDGQQNSTDTDYVTAPKSTGRSRKTSSGSGFGSYSGRGPAYERFMHRTPGAGFDKQASESGGQWNTKDEEAYKKFYEDYKRNQEPVSNAEYDSTVIKPTTAKPSVAEQDAASHATTMYRDALRKTGWTSGVPSEAQRKAAYIDVAKKYNPSSPDTSAKDAEAVKLINAKNARATTQADRSAPAPAPQQEYAWKETMKPTGQNPEEAPATATPNEVAQTAPSVEATAPTVAASPAPAPTNDSSPPPASSN